MADKTGWWIMWLDNGYQRWIWATLTVDNLIMNKTVVQKWWQPCTHKICSLGNSAAKDHILVWRWCNKSLDKYGRHPKFGTETLVERWALTGNGTCSLPHDRSTPGWADCWVISCCLLHHLQGPRTVDHIPMIVAFLYDACYSLHDICKNISLYSYIPHDSCVIGYIVVMVVINHPLLLNSGTRLGCQVPSWRHGKMPVFASDLTYCWSKGRLLISTWWGWWWWWLKAHWWTTCLQGKSRKPTGHQQCLMALRQL